MIKKSTFILIASFLSIFIAGCATTMVSMSPTEVKLMTTKQFDSNKEQVFRSALSLLQSEGYLIDRTDMETGIITAAKRLENKNAGIQRAILGTSKDASTAKAAIYIEEINSGLSEVKLTVYEGQESSTSTGYLGQINKSSNESMVYNAEIYSTWFNNLRAEIERRKALTQ